MKRPNLLAILALLISILSWSSIPLFLKHFTGYLDAWTVNGIRYGIAAVLLLPALRGRPGEPSNGRNLWRDALVPSIINTLGQIGWALIPYFVTASVMGFGIRASFFFTLLGSLWLLPEERYLFRSRAFWVGGVLCIVGIATLFGGSLRGATASVTGLLLLLGASAVWGFYGVTVRKFMRGYTPHRSFAVISLYTAAIVSGFMLSLGRTSALAGLEPRLWGLLALSALLGISLAHVLMIHVLHHLGPVIESGAEMLTPFFTFCGAAVLFGERLSPLQWVGGLGLMAGCALLIGAHRFRPETAVSTDALGLE